MSQEQTTGSLGSPLGLFFADAHLDTHNWVGYPELSGDSMVAFSHLVSVACKLQVPMFGAGDLIDTKNPPSAVVGCVLKMLQKLKQHRLVLYFIQGQHEISTPPWFHLVDGTASEWINGSQITLPDGRNVYGLDWCRADTLQDKLREIPSDSAILLCHQVWSDLMGGIGSCEGSWSDIPHVGTVFTGDYHERVERHVVGASGQDIYAISPGSTNMREITEPSAKYYYVLYERGWSFQRIPTRPLVTARCDNADKFQSVLQQTYAVLAKVLAKSESLPPQIRKPIVYVTYPSDVESAEARVKAVVGDLAFLFFKRVLQGGEEVDRERLERRAWLDRGFVGCLPELLPEHLRRYGSELQSLLVSDSPRDLLRGMREERGLTNVAEVSEIT